MLFAHSGKEHAPRRQAHKRIRQRTLVRLMDLFGFSRVRLAASRIVAEPGPPQQVIGRKCGALALARTQRV